MDVQGAEALVLAGATRTLQSVRIILLELSIVPYNSGEPQFFEMHSLLDRLGYAMYDLVEMHYVQPGGQTTGAQRRDMLIQIDALFVRKSDALWSERETGFTPPRAWQAAMPSISIN